MTEEEAKEVIRDDPKGDIMKRLGWRSLRVYSE